MTEPIWTECVDCGEIRYIFPLGNIYIHTYSIRGSVSYSDTRCGGPTGHPVRETQWWVLTPIPFPVVPIIVRDNWKGSNSERIYPRYMTVYFWEYSGDNPSPGKFRVSPRESQGVRRPNNSVGHLKRI